ncbi:MAG TPA: hypothetical protein VLX29_08355 [Nitrospirota bacterium]|nr:hypothetical protein [Nitrospirota bacterium]
MKNQYFGDINDYRKYGLIRMLSDTGKLRVGICWMLTQDDGRTDGKFVDYLRKRNTYGSYDPPLFDALATCLHSSKQREVCSAEQAGIIPGAVYYPHLLTDHKNQRSEYFAQFSETSKACDLIFFDPDNGLEVSSKHKGTKDSCKYLYWDELQKVYAEGQSVLLYQHFRREKREAMIATLSSQMMSRLGAPSVLAFRTPHVLFLLIPQQTHLSFFEKRAQEVAKRWHPEIKLIDKRPANLLASGI